MTKCNEKKLFWKEIKKEGRGVRCVNVIIKGEDGVHGRGKEVKEIWKSDFERLINKKREREAIV